MLDIIKRTGRNEKKQEAAPDTKLQRLEEEVKSLLAAVGALSSKLDELNKHVKELATAPVEISGYTNDSEVKKHMQEHIEHIVLLVDSLTKPPAKTV